MNPSIENLSTFIQNSHFAAWFFDALLKSFVVLALAGGVCALARRASAATRHLVWILAVASLPCLPLLNYLTQPSWQRPLWTISTGFDSGNQISLALELTPKAAALEPAALPVATETSAANPTSTGARKIAAHFSLNWLALGFATWLGGAALVLISVLTGQFRLRQFSRHGQPLADADWARLLAEASETLNLHCAVALLQSADDVMPMTWGWWRPVILLPADAKNWPAERRRIVLLHELAHVKRRDCLTQLVVQIVCAIYWFNPLVWLAARQMRVERELACDDLVLAGGCKASDYAGHLVEIAGSFRRVPLAAAIAMARSSQLAARVAAIVDGRRNRRRLANVTALAIVVGIFGLGWLVGGCSTIGKTPAAWSLKNPEAAGQIKQFIAEKQAQELKLIAADQKNFAENYSSQRDALVVPDCRPFFAAASRGDWQTVSNLSAELEHHTLGLSKATNGYPHGMWLNPIRETFGAIEAFGAGNGKYSQLFAQDVIQSIPPGSVYFGGTDHGRFVITAMQKSHVHGDPFYTLTQNALADGTYLDYLRSMYEGKIYIPTSEDSQKCFQDYIADAQVRLNENRLKPGEDIKVTQGRVQVSGRTAVMEINALLVKIIFDKNPGREFYLEESFPLDWMYPYLEPHGLIFKINQQPLAEVSDAMVQQDRDCWQKLVPGMIGGWLNDATPVNDVTEFAGKVFLRHDLGNFTGDPGFVQNDYTSKMFSKLRSSIAGLYAWRAEHATAAGEKERMTHAADFAFRQALALCPSSPEAVKRYAEFLKDQHREADAGLVTELAERLKPKTDSAAAPTKASVFQMRLVLDAPTEDTETMTNEFQNGSTARAAEVLNLQKTVLLDQTAVQSAQLVKGPQGDRQIEITLTAAGRKTFAEVTREHLHQRLAIIIDGKLLTAPNIQSEISGGKCQITGSFSEAEAKALAARINAAIGK